MQVPAI